MALEAITDLQQLVDRQTQLDDEWTAGLADARAEHAGGAVPQINGAPAFDDLDDILPTILDTESPGACVADT